MNAKIKKAAQELFEADPNRSKLLYTEDGNFFEETNKSLAQDHARNTGQEVKEITRIEAFGSGKRKSESVESKESSQKSQDGDKKSNEPQEGNGESEDGNGEMPKDEEGNGAEGHDQEQMMKLLDKAEEAGKVVNKSNHFYFGDTKLGHGKKNAANSLVQNQKLAGEIQESLNENAKSE